MTPIAYNIRDHILALNRDGSENKDNPYEINGRKLAAYLLGFHRGVARSPWMASVDIITGYMGKCPRPGDQPRVVVRFNNGEGDDCPWLRHSAGPHQGFFWDVYGDDFQTVELAILALSQAPVPVDVSPLRFTFPLPNPEKQG